MERTIRHPYNYNQLPQVVWEYLTKPKLLALWLMPNDFKPLVGHRFQFGTKPKLKLGFDGRIDCEVVDLISIQKLVYSWKGGLFEENPSLDPMDSTS